MPKTPTLFVSALLICAVTAFSVSANAAGSAFSADERELITAFYSQSKGNGNAGKRGGRQGLPPGIANNLARGKALPPGLATEALPATLQSSLPPVPDGYERVVVDAKILLIETATKMIADIIADAILD